MIMRRLKHYKVYPKLYRKSRNFARREYIVEYELDSLDKGFYHGYIEGVKTVCRALKRMPINLNLGKKRIDKIAEEILGKPKEIKI